MMSLFLTELKAVLIKDDTVWKLENSLVYDSDLLGRIIEIPADFETDFASVPRLPLVYDLFGDRAHYESVPHDYLYCKNSKPVVSRETADKIFLEAMKVRGKGWFVRSMMYAGVRVGGWVAYHKRNVEDKI